MLKATFSFGDAPKRVMEVHWPTLGFRRYYLDGVLVLKRWGGGFTGEQIFDIDGAQLRFVFHLTRKDYYSRVYFGEQLIVPELFPGFAEQLRKNRSQPVNMGVFVLSFTVWMIIGIATSAAYHNIDRFTWPPDGMPPAVLR